jgi:tRNA(Ile)-lysidine synthase TilS/MesJ
MHERFLELCNKLNLRGVSDTWIKGMGTESECREARLDFYERTAGKVLGGGTIVTAHHTDDWVEGYLLNCFRGHPNHDPIPMFSTFNNFKIIHPFLPTTKKDFQDFLVRNSWESWVVEDETNRIVRGSRRNWIRKQILPEMANQKLSLEKFAKRRIKKNIEELAKHG